MFGSKSSLFLGQISFLNYISMRQAGFMQGESTPINVMMLSNARGFPYYAVSNHPSSTMKC